MHRLEQLSLDHSKSKLFTSAPALGEAEGPWRTCSEQDRRGRAQAKMVLVPFAETKGTRLQGRNPAIQKLRRKTQFGIG